ncbi:hypothetical protein ACFWXK_13645 [Streptomyces sp. NPDC059070]
MLRKVAVLAVWSATLAVVNKFWIEPLWGELLFTAVTAVLVAYILGRLDR